MIKFSPHFDIGIPGLRPADGKQRKVEYKYDYERIFRDIADGKLDEKATFRTLILNDLWFIVYFVLAIPVANKPFVVQACQDVEDGPKSETLDIWAREHFKSSIITIAETIQYTLKEPEGATCIFSYARPVSKKFLFEIKETLENNNTLKGCFPDVLWQHPQKEAPVWSLDDGLIVRRSGIRREPNVYAAGLVEGMPTGMHYPRMIFDDIVTEDIGSSNDVMEKVKMKFDSAMNLGTDGGTHRVIGTYYDHLDPLVYIGEKKDIYDKDKSAYLLRLKPATHDGSMSGKPVFLSQKRLDFLKGTKTFNCQQLLDPTPAGVRRLEGKMLLDIEPQFVPKELYKFLLVDPAGDDKDGTGDAWAIMCVGVEPKTDEIGTSRVFILDASISPFRESEATEEIVRMYMRNGMILQVGIEKVGLSTTELHVANALREKGRNISIINKTLVLLKPAGRNKVKRIESALAWPLSNSKIYISTDVPDVYRQRLRSEMDKFPAWHDDGLDALSYLYDIIKDYRFIIRDDDQRDDKPRDTTGMCETTGY